MNGFYVAYLAGRSGTSMLLLAVRNGRLIGVDVGGIKYEGRLQEQASGIGFSCQVHYTVPPGVSPITGVGPVATATNVDLAFDLPPNFAEGPIVRIETPTGPINAKFGKLGDLDL